MKGVDIPSGGQGGDPPEGGPPPPEDHEAERFERAAKLPLNDNGNGQRFVIHFGDNCMFVPRVGWFTWSGKNWVKDPDNLAVRRHAQDLSKLILREIDHLELSQRQREALDSKSDVLGQIKRIEMVPSGELAADDLELLESLRARLRYIGSVETYRSKIRATHRKFATSSGNTARMDNALKEGGVSLAVDFEGLDATPLDVNTESGVLRFSVEDVSAEGGGRVAKVELVPHQRDQRLTKLVPVTFDPAAPHPRFDAFLNRIQPDREMREFIQRWMGVSMTALPLQRLAFFYGGGANGKSVLVDLMARILGNYAATARIESLTGTNRRGGGDATPDLIPLMGARMVRTSEPDEGQRLQEALLKELTGGEPMQVRALHSDFLEVRPVFKLTISGNHKPDIRGTDDGIWRRMMLVPFDVQIPEGERDAELIEKLWDERSGILNWLVQGLIDYLEGGLRPPEIVTAATTEYREESDPIGVFLTRCCVITGSPGDTVASKQLGDAFAYYMIERGMSPWKPGTFARQIAAKARHWKHPETGRQFAKGKSSVTQYVGLRLTDAFKRRLDAAPKDRNGRPSAVSEDVQNSAEDPDLDDF